MSPILIVLLFCFWMYLAYDAFMRGNMVGALAFLAIGVALAAWRWRKRAPAK
jgi:hypothetical protein